MYSNSQVYPVGLTLEFETTQIQSSNNDFLYISTPAPNVKEKEISHRFSTGTDFS